MVTKLVPKAAHTGLRWKKQCEKTSPVWSVGILQSQKGRHKLIIIESEWDGQHGSTLPITEVPHPLEK